VDRKKGRKERTLNGKREKIMNEKKYRSYTEEFKLEALALLKSSGKSATQLERELGITEGMLLKWRDRYQVVGGSEHEKASLAPNDLEAANREIRRLERELQEVAEEREILKKVVSIFSKRKP
jgi:transposase